MTLPSAALKEAAKKKEAERLNLDEYENASYRWDLMIRQPDCITSLLYGQALLQAIKSKPDISFAKIRFVCQEYGECIQAANAWGGECYCAFAKIGKPLIYRMSSASTYGSSAVPRYILFPSTL